MYFVELTNLMPMPDRFARIIMRLLPWYEPARERMRNRRTEAVRLRSINARKRAERVIDAYREADQKR
jgi:hypothetical protein